MSLAGLISIAVVLVGMAIVVLGVVMVVGRRRSTDPECPRCRYALAGLPGADAPLERFEPITCPECGHTAQKRKLLYRRKRRPAWIVAVVLGAAIAAEPLFVGSANRVYDGLSDSSIAWLYASWADPAAMGIVEDRLGQRGAQNQPFQDADLRVMAEGALGRIERGRVGDQTVYLDVLILFEYDHRAPDPEFTAQVAAAMPSLFGHFYEQLRLAAAELSSDRHDPEGSAGPAVEAIDDEDWVVRQTAAIALFTALARGAEVGEAFVKALEAPDARVRDRAALLLQRHAEVELLPEHFREPVRSVEPMNATVAWARTLGILATYHGEDRAIELERRLREGDRDTQLLAIEAILIEPNLRDRLMPNARQAIGSMPPLEWLRQNLRGYRPIEDLLDELGFSAAADGPG
ncbi:MAG: HEAT repeat domain-containing protein [Phycisphaerales bacterium]